MQDDFDQGRKRQSDPSLQQTVHLLEQVFETSQLAVLITDADNRIVRVNAAFTRLTGYQPSDVIGADPRILSSGKTQPEVYEQMWQELARCDHWEGEVWDRHKSGNEYPKWLVIDAVRDSDNHIVNYIASFIDISERKAAEEQLIFLANYDALTALPNRATFLKRFSKALVRSQSSHEKLVVMLLDLDNFKHIVEQTDLETADQVLSQVAHRLKSVARKNDIVARLDGDEFGVILTELEDNLDVAASLADKIVQIIRTPFLLENNKLTSSVSVGMSVFPDDGQSVSLLLRHADQALSQAKQGGRDQYQFFDVSVNKAVSARVHLAQEMQQGLEAGQFSLYYQPKVDTVTGRVQGMEALLRWQHPELGFVSPAAFIPVAEDTGFIIELGDWVLQTACRHLQYLAEQGYDDIHVAVNLSARQFANRHLSQSLARYIGRCHLNPALLELELTESVAMADPQAAAETMHVLQGIGLKLAIDDFGTGYSSLSYLKKFPVSTLKIDRSFVKDIEHDSNDAAICSSTIALAHAMGMKVVAEGVETEAQLNYLKRLDCDMIQGFYFSKPLPQNQVVDFIEQQNQQAGQQSDIERALNVLIIDDDELTCECAVHLLGKQGWRAGYQQNPKTALQQIEDNPDHFQLIFCDMIMPGMSGIDLIERIRQLNRQVPIVIVTSTPAETVRSSLSLLESTHNMIYGKTFMILEKPMTAGNMHQVIDQLGLNGPLCRLSA